MPLFLPESLGSGGKDGGTSPSRRGTPGKGVASFLSGPTRHHSACVAATFFVHFFYLSVFFWMLAKALLILYGILIVFHTLPKSVLVAALFAVGYGCPLLIAAITVAATEPGKGYLRPEACWLNWDMTKALLAFVVPALALAMQVTSELSPEG